MRIKEVRISAPFGIFFHLLIGRQEFEHVGDDLEGMVAIEHTCPEVRLPSQAPSCCHVATLGQCGGCGMEKLRMREWGDLVGWIQAIQVRNVTMLVLWVVAIYQPFHQLSILSYLHRWNLRKQLLHLLLLGSILSQDFRSLDGIAQYIKGYLIVHGATGCHRRLLASWSMFRTYGRHCHFPLCARQNLRIVEIELRGSFQHGIPLA